MKPRTFARRPSSIGSNQLSKSRPSGSPARAIVVLLVMAWSPARRSNAGIRVANPGDYATPNSNHLRDGTGAETEIANLRKLLGLRRDQGRAREDQGSRDKWNREATDPT